MIHCIINWLVYFCHLPMQFLILQIGIILILEHACISYSSQLKPTRDEALVQAYSQYCASGVYDKIKQFFASPKEYSILQFTEFILNHHLWYLYLVFIHCLIFFCYSAGHHKLIKDFKDLFSLEKHKKHKFQKWLSWKIVQT